ncbi:MAG TPA: hypothetical protein VL175_22145 [Pirellulales bacterium]|jgi:hypothetical protein|nr:hypothetical protein [Pirellulales bacterium]
MQLTIAGQRTFNLNLLTRIAQAATLSICASCVPTFSHQHHSPDLAALKAQEFADTAFVKRDYKAAYGLCAPETRAAVSYPAFEAELAKLHQDEFPSRVEATEFEPLPGQAAMNIFLIGHGDTKELYYRIPMAGTSEHGYKPTGFFRRNRAYPPSPLRRPLVAESVEVE